MNFLRGRRIQTAKNPMEISRDAASRPFTQSLAQFLGAPRPGEKSFQQSTQVQSGSADDDGQTATRFNLCQELPRLSRVFAGRNVIGWRDAIEQMVRNTGSFGRRGLGGSNIKLAVHGDRVAIHDLAAEALGKDHRECGLAAGRRSKNNHKGRFQLHRSHRQRKLQ